MLNQTYMGEMGRNGGGTRFRWPRGENDEDDQPGHLSQLLKKCHWISISIVKAFKCKLILFRI